MILYYTGTGNSRHLAEKLQEQLGDDSISLNSYIKNGEDLDVSTAERLIFVLPTYAWRIPRMVETFIRDHLNVNGQPTFFVMNCGDDNGNAGSYLEKLCREKKLALKGVTEIRMPENYIALYDAPIEPKALHIIEKADQKIITIARQISEGELPKKKPSLTDRLKSGMVNSAFYAYIVKDKKFYTKDTCIGCGKCATLCPLNNIALINQKPVWKGHCTHCMACICSCPTEAIEYGKISEGKRRYLCP